MAQRGRDDIIKVFHLRYAWGEDKTIKFRDKQLTIPGVATLLRNLITGTTAPGKVVENGEKFLVPSLMKLKGRGLAELRRIDDPDETGRGETEAVAITLSPKKKKEILSRMGDIIRV